MSDLHFTLVRLHAAAPGTLEMVFADGQALSVDLRSIYAKTKTLHRLKDWKVFKTAAIADQGRSVQWLGDDNLELAADNLRARAIEQSGQYSHEWLWNWMHRHGLTLDTAAQALGISRRMLAYYRSGAKPLPLTVALACYGWESRGKLAA